MKTKQLIIAFIFSGILSSTAFASDEKDITPKQKEKDTVEHLIEAEELAARDIVEIAVANENFSTLVAALKAAGLVETLSGDGPFTVFAPTNDAFAKLPDGTVDGLLKPESKDALTGILTYHVVSGKFDAGDLIRAILKNDGSFSIPTVQGGSLVATMSQDGDVILTDENGNTSTVVVTDVIASNGVIHAIDSVVMPK